MNNSSNSRAKIFFGVLALGGAAVVSKLIYDYLRKARSGQRFHIKPVYVNGSKYINQRDLFMVIQQISRHSREEISKIVLYYRNIRRKHIDNIAEYETIIEKMQKKIEKCLGEVSLLVFQDFGINQTIFEKSIDYYNDEEIQNALEQLSSVEEPKERTSNLQGKAAIDVLEFYNKIQQSVLESTDLQCFNSATLACQIEDKIWQEFGVEINEVSWNDVKFSDNKKTQTKFEQLSRTLLSVQKFNKSLLK